MHEIEFIQDLAVILLVAAFITIVFHRFKQPVVLGYIIAGVIIGPHTPPFEFVNDQQTIKTFANLGVIFLMFSLGLEFSFRKLSKVGIAVLLTAVMEIVAMIWIGYGIGRLFHWQPIDALFLGAMLAISSTTIIFKALKELNLQRHHFVQLIFGILVIEDILGIAIIVLLSSIAVSGSVNTFEVFAILSKLTLFIVMTLLLGILIIPKLLDYVAKFGSNEILLITVLGLCFGFCLVAVQLDYSIVFGAFIIGAIIAESRQLVAVERLIEPIRDMFSAIFFVAIGLLLDPRVLVNYALPIVVITVAVVFGKIVTCSLGILMTGQNGKTSLRVGMGLAQIGEFSFIIAALGTSLQVTSDFLYPIAVAVSSLTTIMTPYLIKMSDPISDRITKIIPPRIVEIFHLYTVWLQSIKFHNNQTAITKAIKQSLLQAMLNLAFVVTIFLSGSYFARRGGGILMEHITNIYILKTVIWSIALFVSLPFLIATYRKIKALSMLLAEIGVKENVTGKFTIQVRKIISNVIPAVSLVVIMLIVFALSYSILPPREWIVMILILTAILAASLWRWLIKLHSRLQISLMERLDQKK